MATIEEIRKLKTELEQERIARENGIARAHEKLKDISYADLLILKTHWESERKKYRKLDPISIQKRQETGYWLEAIEGLLNNPMREKTRDSTESSRKNENISDNISAEDAAIYLTISKSKLYKMTSKNEIPFHKLGEKLVFSKTELDKYIKEQRKSTTKEINNTAEILLANRSKKKSRSK